VWKCGSRFSLRGLCWLDVDLESGAPSLSIRRQSTKTDAGARVRPLNHGAQVAYLELRERARKIGSDEAEHYVFPACENNKVDAATPTKG